MVGKLQDYLASDESIVHSWEGEITDGGSSRKGVLAVTDRRVVYLAGGSFKDIEYSHITSVETEVEELPDVNLPLILMGLGGVCVILGFLTIGGVGVLNTAVLIVGGLLFVGLGYLMKDIGLDEASPDPTHTVKIITGDEDEQELTFEMEKNVGAEISSTLREKA